MESMMLLLGRVFGFGGAALCALALVMRVSGNHWAGGFQVGTILQGGIAAMIFGCFCLLLVLVQRSVRR